MGMGYAANFIPVIEQDDLKKVGNCQKLLERINFCLGVENCNLDALAQLTNTGDEGEEIGDSKDNSKRIWKLYAELQKEFKKQTKLELHLGFHSTDDEGDRYDDVDGAYWWVEGFTVISKEGKAANKKFKINIKNKGFVTFG